MYKTIRKASRDFAVCSKKKSNSIISLLSAKSASKVLILYLIVSVNVAMATSLINKEELDVHYNTVYSVSLCPIDFFQVHLRI